MKKRLSDEEFLAKEFDFAKARRVTPEEHARFKEALSMPPKIIGRPRKPPEDGVKRRVRPGRPPKPTNEMSSDEREKLNASIDRGLAQISSGHGVSAAESLAQLRRAR